MLLEQIPQDDEQGDGIDEADYLLYKSQWFAGLYSDNHRSEPDSPLAFSMRLSVALHCASLRNLETAE